MITVTAEACAHLAQIIKKNDLPEPQAIRLVAGQEGLGLTPDKPRDGDATFEHGGRTVLAVDQTIAERLEGRTLDVEGSGEQTQLRLA